MGYNYGIRWAHPWKTKAHFNLDLPYLVNLEETILTREVGVNIQDKTNNKLYQLIFAKYNVIMYTYTILVNFTIYPFCSRSNIHY